MQNLKRKTLQAEAQSKGRCEATTEGMGAGHGLGLGCGGLSGTGATEDLPRPANGLQQVRHIDLPACVGRQWEVWPVGNGAATDECKIAFAAVEHFKHGQWLGVGKFEKPRTEAIARICAFAASQVADGWATYPAGIGDLRLGHASAFQPGNQRGPVDWLFVALASRAINGNWRRVELSAVFAVELHGSGAFAEKRNHPAQEGDAENQINGDLAGGACGNSPRGEPNDSADVFQHQQPEQEPEKGVHLRGLLLLCLAGGLGHARNHTSNTVGGGLWQRFGPEVDGLNGAIAHGLCRLLGRSAKQFDCASLFHAAIVNMFTVESATKFTFSSVRSGHALW